jgi:Cu+-exporting ATPase
MTCALEFGDHAVAGRATMHTIKQNLFWAFIYNSVGVPIAALGFLNPIIAAAVMALSSLSVIVNSALLKRVKLVRQHEFSVADESHATH